MGVDLKKLASDLMEVYEKIDQINYDRASYEALRRLALKVDVDYTIDPDLVLEQIGEKLDELLSAVAELSPKRADNEIYIDGESFFVEMPNKPSWTRVEARSGNRLWFLPVMLTKEDQP